MKNSFTSDENTLSKKKFISCFTTSQANCSANRMICSRFLSDYLEIFSAAPRKSLDNHSKTSHRSSCFPHSFFEVVEHENNYYDFSHKLWQGSASMNDVCILLALLVILKGEKGGWLQCFDPLYLRTG